MQDLCQRLLTFSIKSITYIKTINHSIENNVVIRQVTRSSTSIGANYEESQAASSKADFYNKIKISLKEARETAYWFKILKSMKLGDKIQLDILISEVNEIKLILGSISSSQTKKH